MKAFHLIAFHSQVHSVAVETMFLVAKYNNAVDFVQRQFTNPIKSIRLLETAQLKWVIASNMSAMESATARCNFHWTSRGTTVLME